MAAHAELVKADGGGTRPQQPRQGQQQRQQDDTAKRLAAMEKLLKDHLSGGGSPQSPAGGGAEPVVGVAKPPWHEKAASANMGPISETDDDKVKREKLASQLSMYEAALKSLPGGQEDPIRVATADKITQIREQQNALLTPAIAHRRTAQNLHRAKQQRDKLEHDVQEKTQKIQELQKALEEQQAQLDAKRAEVQTPDAEYKRTAALIAEGAESPGPAVPEPSPIKIELSPEEVDDEGVRAFLGSAGWDKLKTILTDKVKESVRQQAPSGPGAAQPAAGPAPASGGGIDKPAGGGDVDMEEFGAEDFAQRQEAFKQAAESLRAASPEDRDDAKRKYLEAVAALGIKRARRS